MRPFARTLLIALIAVVAGAGVATLASAGTSTPRSAHAKTVLRTAQNATIGARIVVDTKGRTLYELSGETRTHLLCTSSACLSAWPPATVASARTKVKGGAGVKGAVGTIRRSGGARQITLGGHPLCRFAGDGAAGDANGNGIQSFGGTWGVVRASSRTQATTTTTTTQPGYGYGPAGGY